MASTISNVDAPQPMRMPQVPPKTLSELVEIVINVAETQPNKSRATVLVDVLRRYRFWPALQVKKFFSEPDLVLLHNTYKREDTAHFQQLYDECRSVVLNMTAPIGENIVVTYASSIPQRLSDVEYEAFQEDTDVVELAYEGTVVTTYHYNNKWYFGTTGCPTIDSSRYHHPTKTHGIMLDEALGQSREEFVERLDPTKAYAFLLIHHDNKHLVDYTKLFDGDAEYAKLVCLSCKDRVTFEECPTTGVIVSSDHLKTAFASPSAALEYLRDEANTPVYGLIVKKPDGQLIKVSATKLIEREEKDLGNSNPWINMLNVYIKNKPTYKITDYQKEFAPELTIPVTSRGRELAPTYLIHTIICNVRDILFNSYVMTTSYNPMTKYYNFNKETDAMYAPILRFHLAQLRQLQVTTHSHTMLTPQAVYNYICHRQTMKNLRLLIGHFAGICNTAIDDRSTMPYGIPHHVAECFCILATHLAG